jgi:hypothetical protein
MDKKRRDEQGIPLDISRWYFHETPPTPPRSGGSG